MCPVCPAQTIDQTEVTLAQQMRAQVRELLAGGASRAETLEWFRERYGPGIVAEPPRSGFNLIAWLAPGAVVIIGLAGGVLALRAMRRPAGAGVSGGGNIPSGAGGNAGDGSISPGPAATLAAACLYRATVRGSSTGSEADELLPWLDAWIGIWRGMASSWTTFRQTTTRLATNRRAGTQGNAPGKRRAESRPGEG